MECEDHHSDWKKLMLWVFGRVRLDCHFSIIVAVFPGGYKGAACTSCQVATLFYVVTKMFGIVSLVILSGC